MIGPMHEIVTSARKAARKARRDGSPPAPQGVDSTGQARSARDSDGAKSLSRT